jgi:putative phosphoribosyl transferase
MDVHSLNHLDDNVFDLPDLRNKVGVFHDRIHAGKVLCRMLESYRNTALVLAIPAGGLPVARVMAAELELQLDVVVVSKATLPWNTEVGYGAVAFDGTVILNDGMVSQAGLTEEEIQEGIKKASIKVKRRMMEFRSRKPFPDLRGRPVILVDDGIASGFTMLVALEALKKAGANHLIIAVPTAHWDSIKRMSSQVETLYCANIRSGWAFAVADAYQIWSDVDEEEVIEILKEFD